MLKQYLGLPRQVYIICFARIITAMGAFMFSMNSLLMTSILGLSEVMTGYVMVLLAVCDIVGCLVGGKLSDRYGRKKVLMTVMAIEILGLIFGGIYVRTYWVIACESLVMFCFSMFFPIIGALITDKTQQGKREESFSLLFLCVNVGFALGQVIAGLIFYNYTEWIFWGQGISTLIMMLILGFFVEDDYVPEQKAITEKPAKNRQNLLTLILKDKPLVLFLIATVFTGYA
ncbi:MAG: MFS transporter, partial [Firmicutes bacterium]|nr:MFS transporter [Bacillota bacterium]